MIFFPFWLSSIGALIRDLTLNIRNEITITAFVKDVFKFSTASNIRCRKETVIPVLLFFLRKGRTEVWARHLMSLGFVLIYLKKFKVEREPFCKSHSNTEIVLCACLSFCAMGPEQYTASVLFLKRYWSPSQSWGS